MGRHLNSNECIESCVSRLADKNVEGRMLRPHLLQHIQVRHRMCLKISTVSQIDKITLAARGWSY